MRRAFLSLYGLLVISVVAVGWGLDRLWSSYFDQGSENTSYTTLVATLASAIDQPAGIVDINPAEDGSLKIKIFSLESFAKSNLLDNIQLGQPVEAHHSKTATTYYQLLPTNQSVMRIEITHSKSDNGIYSDILLIVFYGSLALVVFMWMWPLSRDLAKLKKQTRILGKEPIPPQWHIGPTSAIYDLARAFSRMSDRIQELLASHQEMTYAVSHELRTPLARMKFALEIASTQKSPEKIIEKLQSVRDDVTEMDSLVNQLLAYAGFEQSSQELDIQSGDLKAMVEQLLTRVATDQRFQHIQLSVDSKLTDPVRCEWGLMERAIINLVLNAMRFAKTQVLIKLSQEQNDIRVEVHDDGPGIPPDERSRVLQSFVRLTNHTNSQNRGFGLGLAIVNRVMTWHQGKVIVGESQFNGALVALCWPANL